jgi:hypothetical protein
LSHTGFGAEATTTDLGRRLHTAGAARAARYADGFTAPNASRKVYDSYLEQVSNSIRFAGGFIWLIGSNDPDKTFNEAADHIIYRSNSIPNGRRRRDKTSIRFT